MVNRKLHLLLFAFRTLRWDFVYQRPQHLLSRFATMFTVYFVEEPFHDAHGEPRFLLLLKVTIFGLYALIFQQVQLMKNQKKFKRTLLDKFLKNKNSR